MAKKGTEIAKTGPQDLQDQFGDAPAHLAQLAPEHQGAGMEKMEKDDLVIPRLSICQSMSPQRKKSDPSFIEGLSEGHLFNTVTRRNYGDQPIRLLPLFFFKTQLYFEDMDKGGGIKCQSLNGIDGGALASLCKACPHNQFRDGKRPDCTKIMNYPALILPDFDLVVVSMKGMSLKVGKQWNSLARMARDKYPFYAKVYDIGAKEMTNNFGTFHIFTVNPGVYASEEEFRNAQAIFDSLQEKAVKVDTAGMAEEENDGQAGSEL